MSQFKYVDPLVARCDLVSKYNQALLAILYRHCTKNDTSFVLTYHDRGLGLQVRQYHHRIAKDFGNCHRSISDTLEEAIRWLCIPVDLDFQGLYHGKQPGEELEWIAVKGNEDDGFWGPPGSVAAERDLRTVLELGDHVSYKNKVMRLEDHTFLGLMLVNPHNTADRIVVERGTTIVTFAEE